MTIVFIGKLIKQISCTMFLVAMFNTMNVLAMNNGINERFDDSIYTDSVEFGEEEFDSMDNAAVHFGIDVFSNPTIYQIDEYEYDCGIYKTENGKYRYTKPYT